MGHVQVPVPCPALPDALGDEQEHCQLIRPELLRRSGELRHGPRSTVPCFEPEGGYVATVPSLPGLHTEGDTFEEAQEMAVDAIRCYIEGCILDEGGEPRVLSVEPIFGPSVYFSRC